MGHDKLRYAYAASLLVVICAGAFAACGGVDSGQVNILNGQGGGAGTDLGEPGGSSNNGGGGGVIDSDAAPQVLSVTPATAAVDAEPGTKVTLTFSESLNVDTVTPTSVTVTQGTTAILGTVQVVPDTQNTVVEFTPTSRLTFLGTYTVTVTADVKDAAGTSMAQPFTSTFTVRDGAWTERLTIAENVAGSDDQLLLRYSSPYVPAVDNKGNTLFVWETGRWTPESTRISSVWARFYVDGVGLTAPLQLDLSEESASMPAVAMNANGDAIVAWNQNEGTNVRIYARRYIAGQWEAAPQRVDTANNTASADDIVVAAAANGDFHVVWKIGTSGSTVLYASSTSGATAWPSTDYDAFVASSASMSTPAVAFDGTGTGFLAYFANSTAGSELPVRRYLLSSRRWEGFQSIPGAASTSAVHNPPSVAVDGTGGAMVGWTTGTDVKTSRYTKARGWSEPLVVDDIASTTDGYIQQETPGLAWNGSGFMATWVQSVAGVENVYSDVFDGTAWKTESDLVSDGERSVNYASFRAAFGLDALANGVAVWTQSPTGSDPAEVVASRYVAGSGWKPVATVAPADKAAGFGDTYNDVTAAVSSNGMAAAQWNFGYTYENLQALYASVFR